MFTSIRVRLAVLFLLVGLIPALGVGISSYLIAAENMRNEVFRSMNIFSDLKDDDLTRYFQDIETSGRVIAASAEVISSLEILQAAGGDTSGEEWLAQSEELASFLHIMQQEFGFEQIYVTDQNATVIYDTMGVTEGQNLQMHRYVYDAKRGRHSWSKLHYSPDIRKNCMVFSSPVYAAGGTVMGTVSISCNDDMLAYIVHKGIERLGRTADAYLVDEDGLLLTNTIRGEYAEGGALKYYLDNRAIELVSEAIIDGNMDFKAAEEFTGVHGRRVLGQVGVSILGDSPVGLVIEMERDEAFGGVDIFGMVLLAVMVVIAAVIIIIGLLLAGGIARPLQKVTALAGEIAGGDFTVYADVKRKDEIGHLAQAFNTMCENLRGLIKQAVETAEGVTSGSGAVSTAAAEMSASLEEITAATNQFAENAHQLSDGAQRMSETSSLISRRAEDGKRAVEQVTGQMKVINNCIFGLQAIIAQVDKRSEDIGQFLSIIRDIAGQTNLLALNAAIEAARAGEQGRGFAVVADEVRKLAEQSSRAASEIEELIRATQEESDTALESIKQGVAEAETGTAVVAETGKTFNDIINNVMEIAGQIESIAAATRQLSSGSQEISSTVEEQSLTMEEVAASSQELHAAAEKLMQALQQFKYR